MNKVKRLFNRIIQCLDKLSGNLRFVPFFYARKVFEFLGVLAAHKSTAHIYRCLLMENIDAKHFDSENTVRAAHTYLPMNLSLNRCTTPHRSRMTDIAFNRPAVCMHNGNRDVYQSPIDECERLFSSFATTRALDMPQCSRTKAPLKPDDEWAGYWIFYYVQKMRAKVEVDTFLDNSIANVSTRSCVPITAIGSKQLFLEGSRHLCLHTMQSGLVAVQKTA